jgi:uncharacterized damage-inducible protein DinB
MEAVPGCAHDRRGFSARQRCELQSLQARGHPHRGGVDTKTLEQPTTDKGKVIATLKASYAHAKAAIRSMPDTNLEKTLEWNGGKITERGVLLYTVQHIAQHRGQQIAYARLIGVVPPWTLDPPRKN